MEKHVEVIDIVEISEKYYLFFYLLYDLTFCKDLEKEMLHKRYCIDNKCRVKVQLIDILDIYKQSLFNKKMVDYCDLLLSFLQNCRKNLLKEYFLNNQLECDLSIYDIIKDYADGNDPDIDYFLKKYNHKTLNDYFFSDILDNLDDF